MVSGRGEIFESTKLDLSGYYLALVYPNIHISTAEAYGGVKPQKAAISIKEMIDNHPVKEWKGKLKK